MTDRLADQVLAGQRRAVARAISLVESNDAEARTLLSDLHRNTGRAHIVGVTGPPGSGKSSLVNALTLHLRRGTEDQPPKTVGIVAVDPTSPFTGGAILGDRIRMRDLAGDPGVFIRSMASRGNLGGLAWATADAVKVLDAAGFELIIVETVGVGQAEVDIARTAHTTIVVEVPGLGDDIQAIKAGILEIADVFAVNKADLDGADQAVMALQMMLDLNRAEGQSVVHHGRFLDILQAVRPPEESTGVSPWRPPIHKTVATQRKGIAELAAAIEAHRVHLEQSGGLVWRERERAASELEIIIQQESLRRVLAHTDRAILADRIDRIAHREQDAYAVGQALLGSIGHGFS